MFQQLQKEKLKSKKTAVQYVIGAVLVFAAGTVLKLLNQYLITMLQQTHYDEKIKNLEVFF